MWSLPQVPAKLELIKISFEMTLRTPNVSPADPALHHQPEGFNGVCMDGAAHPFLAEVVDLLLLIAMSAHRIEGPCAVCIERGTLVHG